MPRPDTWKRRMERLFGTTSRNRVWMRERTEGAFVQIPRILSLASLGPAGRLTPLDRLLLWELWSLSWSGQFVIGVDLTALVFALGLKGKRATRTVRDALAAIEGAGFIETKESAGEISVLLLSPYFVIKQWQKEGKVDVAMWERLKRRLEDFGGPELVDDEDLVEALVPQHSSDSDSSAK